MRIKRKIYGRMGSRMFPYFLPVFLCLFIGLYASCVSARAEEQAQTDDTPVNFVLVLDCSGTMDSNDPTGLAVSAAKMFVDMLPSENANLSVIVFGADYSGQEGCYDLTAISELSEAGVGDSLSANRVKLVWELSDITTQEAKSGAKEAIETALADRMEGDVTYTPIGYALQAAYQVLADGGAETDSAAIILLSDGQVTGQNDSYSSGWEFTSVDSAVAKIRTMDWPIYCMELNYKGENDSGSAEGNVGSHMMREVIPETSEDHIELSSATEAQDAFASIFEKFFDVTPEVSEPMVVTNGECSRTIVLDELIAETAITLTGTAEDIGAITDVTITDVNGQSAAYSGNQVTDSRVVTFEDKYITIKLLTPSAGEWKITVHGTDGIEIGLYAVSIHEMDLKLTTTAAESENGVIAKGATVEFYASFEYHGSQYVSSSVYQTYPAILVIDGPDGVELTMTGSDKDYSCSYTFSKSGTYHIVAYVADEALFRSGRKESGEYTFTVGNIETSAYSEIGDREVGVGGQLEEIDCSMYFTNEDNDTLTWSVSYDRTSGITHDMSEDGVLTLHAGTVAGSYLITIGARDGMMESDAVQTFTLTVTNQELALAGGVKDGGTEVLEFSYNAAAIPQQLRRLVNISDAAGADILWSDYFTDADGLPPVIEITANEESDSIEVTWDQEAFHASGSGAGKAAYTVIASDQSDSSICYTLTIEVRSLDALALLWNEIRVPVMIAAVVLILLLLLLLYGFTGRKIYGIWEIGNGERKKTGCVLERTKEGAGKKARLGQVLENLELSNQINGVWLYAGNKFSKKVYITGLENLDGFTYGTERFDKTRRNRTKKQELKTGIQVTLVKGSSTITMKRKK